MRKRVNMTPRCQRIIRPLGVVCLLVFVAFMAHLLAMGTSAFPGGSIEGGQYLVHDHGKVITLTAAEYWCSYALGILLVCAFGLQLVLSLFFMWTGDLTEGTASA